MVQSCVTTFRAIGTTGTQTVTGIQDRNGNAFVPEFLMFLSSSSELNTLFYNGTALYNTFSFETSWYRASDDSGGCYGLAELPQFGLKIISGFLGFGINSAYANYEADGFGGGNPYRYGNISRVASGEFDLTITHNANFFATDVIVVAFAGVDTDYALFGGNLGVHTTAFQPQGLLTANAGFDTTNPGNPAAGTGGVGGFGWGFDSPNGGAFSVRTMTSDAVSRYQKTGSNSALISATGRDFHRNAGCGY